MQAWILAGVRIDIELAVALEVGVLALTRAEGAAARDRAIGFNRELWRLAATLSTTAPERDDREQLAAAAARVLRAPHDEIAAINRRIAGQLAGRAATTGSLRLLMDAWRSHAARRPDAEFGPWLMDRLAQLAHPTERKLAA